MAAAEVDRGDEAGLPRELVFVDLETTGGNAAFHRITEVGLVRMRDGIVVEEWSSLVNPECRIPAYIEAFTGISNDMVASAPRFAQIAALVFAKLESAVFVAHNARFDYAFLRTEFRRLQMAFSPRVLCTVKLSRRLFPEHHRHGLDAVMERHGLACAARHRALGDARVLGDFWRLLLDRFPAQTLAAAAGAVIGAHRLPAHLPAGLADELPDVPGVYRFFGENDALLYIGKSHSLRNRILSHFATEHGGSAEQKKIRLTRRIDWIETAGVLGAELIEAQLIKQQHPLLNKRLKRQADNFTWRATGGDASRPADGDAGHPAKGGNGEAGGPGKAGGPGVRLTAVEDLGADGFEHCFGLFRSAGDARRALTEIARAHALCLKVLGLEKPASAAGGSCFAHQVGKCRGVCVGKEPRALHDLRLMLALSALKLKAWPFPGRIALKEGHSEHHVLDPWAYLGTVRSEEELAALRDQPGRAAFDVDVYRILARFLAKNPKVTWQTLSAVDDGPAAGVA